ncbi:hypothetical protein K353_04272 [Kitasatospora sp. SolWspMP-SS2h]|uniref:hypothetical protein n=1 Tax=Kitasatospora sp. SolWspMP-SS2h TaxID=1305729 RepID=UPI000DBA278D|nr:hypothetical protein [Kitasatospora sp. SolWspMP-SS2h]RAJ38338.1 hypothetical protein K353_04272 [Kitasatospora sp. SolWspMP-SS2h]
MARYRDYAEKDLIPAFGDIPLDAESGTPPACRTHRPAHSHPRPHRPRPTHPGPHTDDPTEDWPMQPGDHHATTT